MDDFANNDAVSAKDGCLKDSEVDKIRNINFIGILEHIKSETINIDRVLHLMRIFSNLE